MEEEAKSTVYTGTALLRQAAAERLRSEVWLRVRQCNSPSDQGKALIEVSQTKCDDLGRCRNDDQGKSQVPSHVVYQKEFCP
jgi:hypothetical protein